TSGDLIYPLGIIQVGRRLLLRSGVSAWHGFPRDVCFLFENIFFATGKGLEIDDYAVTIFQDAQPKRRVPSGRVADFTAK
ncbi:hypothetical protein MYX84_11495, partial [Acidobacteria bacterium AH-259-O06]|nr:hypothetical protein [Acidobacteria bacterium AH-259-O06]